MSPGLKSALASALHLVQPVWTKANELALNIDTVPPPGLRTPEGKRPKWRGEFSPLARHDDNIQYATPDFWYIRKVVKLLDPGPEDVFYDLGCGMGRVVCMVARKRLRKCVGVELFEPVCHAARRNARRLRGRKALIEIIHGDAATAALSDGTIYFMFNPFGGDTLRDVLGNIKASLLRRPRAVKIAYFNDVHADVLRACAWLEMYHQFQTAHRVRVSFWRNASHLPA